MKGQDQKIRIAWFSPLGLSDATKSAIYTNNLLPMLPESWHIELFVNDQDWLILDQQSSEEELTYLNRPVHHFIDSWRRNEETKFNCFIYHLEDSCSSSFVSKAMFFWPGITFFHDLNLNSLGFEDFSKIIFLLAHQNLEDQAMVSGSLRDLLKVVPENDVRTFWDWRDRGLGLDIFDYKYPRFQQELFQSAISAVCFPRFLKEIPEDLESAFCSLPLKLRKENSVTKNEESFEIGYSGSALRNVNYQAVLASVVRLIKENPEREINFSWFVDGENSKQVAERVIEEFSVQRGSIAVKEVSNLANLSSAISNLDLFIETNAGTQRSPTSGFYLALSNSIPVLTLNIAGVSEVPEKTLLNVNDFQDPEESCFQQLQKCLKDPKILWQISEGSRNYVAMFHGVEESVSDLIHLIIDKRSCLQNKLSHKDSELIEKKQQMIEKLCKSDSLFEEILNEEGAERLRDELSNLVGLRNN
jgi:hypothetical protein